MDILHLPIEIINEILQYLTTKEICNSLLISKSFQEIFLNKKVKLNLNLLGTKIHDDYFGYFKCIYIINLSECNQITDKGLEFLKDVHTIYLSYCYQITDKGLEFLKGIHTIDLYGCNKITNKGLEFLKGVYTINLIYCNQITDEGLEFLKDSIIHR